MCYLKYKMLTLIIKKLICFSFFAYFIYTRANIIPLNCLIKNYKQFLKILSKSFTQIIYKIYII